MLLITEMYVGSSRTSTMELCAKIRFAKMGLYKRSQTPQPRNFSLRASAFLQTEKCKLRENTTNYGFIL